MTRPGEIPRRRAAVVTAGWPMILSSLKSLIETGKPLEFRRTGRGLRT
jgi:hypothetical protein